MAKAIKLASLRAISNSALSAKTLPKRLKVLDWGLNKTLKGDVIVDDQTVKIFQANQAKVGRERAPIDFDHNTVRGTDAHKDLAGKPPVIFGYGTPTLIPGDGIWFEDIVWTPHGEENARNFHDLSPTPLLDEDNRVLAIHSCALTPAGAVEGLSFYSAFESITEFSKVLAAERSYLPDAYKEQWKVVQDQGLHPTGPMNKEHFDYFRKAFKLSTNSSDEDVHREVMKAMVAKCMSDGADEGTVMKHMAAMFGHCQSNPDPNNQPHMNQFPSEGGPVYKQLKAMIAEAVKPFQTHVETLNAEIKALKDYKADTEAGLEQAQKDALIAQATKEGKVVPMSAEDVKITPLAVIKNIVTKLEKAEVPVKRMALRPLSADGKPEKRTRADSARAIDEQIATAENNHPIRNL